MSSYDRAVEAVENAAEASPDTLVTAILGYFSRADLVDFVERYIDDTIDQDDEEEETDDSDTTEQRLVELREEQAQLLERLAQQGGRGLELADEIDDLTRRIENLEMGRDEDTDTTSDEE